MQVRERVVRYVQIDRMTAEEFEELRRLVGVGAEYTTEESETTGRVLASLGITITDRHEEAAEEPAPNRATRRRTQREADAS